MIPKSGNRFSDQIMRKLSMDAVNPHSSAPAVAAPRARIGLIIPSVNRLSEPQFNRYAPPALGIHITRARVAGQWKRPLDQLAEEIRSAAGALSDCKPDLIVFHCTDTSMSEGPAGEERIMRMIGDETGIAAVSTSTLVAEAMRALGMTKVVLISPYKSNADVISYLGAVGVAVVHDVKLGLEGLHYPGVTPQQWLALAIEHDRPQADGIFLSCTNTTQIEAIAAVERALGKPVVNSNQAVLWGALTRLRDKLDAATPMPELGRLLQTHSQPG
jgi:maleate cis-trans isomerase